MKQVLKLFLKHRAVLLIVIALIAGQAYADLSLPAYTAGIIDIGISNKGVDEIVPKILTNYGYTSLIDRANQLKLDTSELRTAYVITPNNISDSAENTTGGDFFQLKNPGDAYSPSLQAVTEPALARVADVPKLATYSEAATKIRTYVREQYEACGVDLAARQTDYLLRNGGLMLLFTLISCTLLFTTQLLSARVGAAFAKELRAAVFGKVLQFSNNEYNKFSIASLITRCTNDIQQVQIVFIMLIRMIVYSPIVGITAFVRVMHTEVSLSWLIGVAILVVLGLVAVLFAVAIPKFRMVQTLVDRLNLVSREILTGLPVIRAFSREKYEKERFDKANKDLTQLNLFTIRAMQIMMPTMILIMNFTAAGIMWYGAKNVAENIMGVGTIMQIVSYMYQIIFSFLMLSMVSIMLPRALVSLRRSGEVLDCELSVTDMAELVDRDEKRVAKENTAEKSPESAVGKSKKKSKDKAADKSGGKAEPRGVLEFDNVGFKFEGAEDFAIRNISFKSGPGEITAIIGSTGAGKSTLVNLIPRFYNLNEGVIRVDGTDIAAMPQKLLRSKVGLVPQKAMLFAGTVESNVKYAGNVSDEDMVQAVTIAQALEFVESDPDKYNRRISQSGSNVSGGQKQRLSIARAIAKKPEIYIFDDSFSALDYKTDSNLRAALAEFIKKTAATTIIVAQRISTVLRADRIIVLEEGKIAGCGKHAELMKSCDVYRDIALSQLSEEQLSQF